MLLMQCQRPHGALAAAWILGAGLIGLLGNVTSIGGAAAVLGLGLVPPMLLMLHRSRPVQLATVHVHQASPRGGRIDR